MITEDIEDFLQAESESDIKKFNLEDRYGSKYQVIMRFRNREDYFEFADLIQQPKLKVYSKLRYRETDWPMRESENSLWDQE